MTNLAPVPDELTDEQVLMCPDIMSTGCSRAESGKVKMGDTAAVSAQGPIGLCATAGGRLMGATTIIGVDAVSARMDIARRMGADQVVDFTKVDPVDEIMRLTDGRGGAKGATFLGGIVGKKGLDDRRHLSRSRPGDGA